MIKSIFLILSFLFIVSSTNYIQCGENIITILPELKTFTQNVHLSNLNDIGEGLSYLKRIATSIAENCGINQSLYDAYYFVKFLEACSANCFSNTQTISQYALEIMKRPDDIISAIEYLEKIFMVLPQTLKNCENLIPHELIEYEEMSFLKKKEEEMDIFLDNELFLDDNAGEFSETEIEIQIDYDTTLTLSSDISDFTNQFQTFLQDQDSNF